MRYLPPLLIGKDRLVWIGIGLDLDCPGSSDEVSIKRLSDKRAPKETLPLLEKPPNLYYQPYE